MLVDPEQFLTGDRDCIRNVVCQCTNARTIAATSASHREEVSDQKNALAAKDLNRLTASRTSANLDFLQNGSVQQVRNRKRRGRSGYSAETGRKADRIRVSKGPSEFSGFPSFFATC
jgi:hypothetical protein